MSVLAARLLQIRGRRDDHLGIALLISLAVHAALLTVHFTTPPQPPPPDVDTLEVTLINVRGDTPPMQAQMLAQHDFDGGGEAPEGIAATPLPLTAPDATDDLVLAALQQRQKELEAEQERLFALLQAREAAAAAGQVKQQGESSGESGDDELHQESVIISARIAAIKERIERYNARPRQHFVGPSAASVPHARYVEAWRQKIELLGIEHYPPEARGKIYGSLQLTVYIRRDGSLQKVVIDRPSPHAVLNQAALRIVQLAAPFAPLPPELAHDTDILAITRTWHFTHEQLETRQP
ncbi:MAG TPA: TonB family protein [Burkholderiaceae bacterium]|nr:TonB family protein [Burkholderiaceae bacterium]